MGGYGRRLLDSRAFFSFGKKMGKKEKKALLSSSEAWEAIHMSCSLYIHMYLRCVCVCWRERESMCLRVCV
jgi:hypothetical protein